MEHLFTIHETPVDERVEFCVFYLRDDALVWWRWLEKQKGFVTWPDFHGEMLLQYGPDELKDPMSALAKLKRMGEWLIIIKPL